MKNQHSQIIIDFFKDILPVTHNTFKQIKQHFSHKKYTITQTENDHEDSIKFVFNEFTFLFSPLKGMFIISFDPHFSIIVYEHFIIKSKQAFNYDILNNKKGLFAIHNVHLSHYKENELFSPDMKLLFQNIQKYFDNHINNYQIHYIPRLFVSDTFILNFQKNFIAQQLTDNLPYLLNNRL